MQLFQLLRGVSRVSNLEMRVVLLNEGLLAERLRTLGLQVIVLDESHLSFPTIAARLARYAREWRPAVIHTHRRKEHVLGALAAISCGAATIATIHGRSEFEHAPWDLRQRLLGQVESLVLTQVHRKLIAVSDDLVDGLPGPDHKKVVIPNCIDVDEVRSRAAEPFAHGLRPGRTHVAFLGRLVRVKRVDKILRAMALLRQQEPDAYMLHVVGDGPLRTSLERHASELGLSETVRFHGFMPNPLPLLAQMNALIFASAHEGLPMTALEALALGVPLATTPIPSLARLVNESGAGCTARSTDPRDLAEAIRRVSHGRRELQSPGRPSLPECYEIQSGVRSMLELWMAASERSA